MSVKKKLVFIVLGVIGMTVARMFARPYPRTLLYYATPTPVVYDIGK